MAGRRLVVLTGMLAEEYVMLRPLQNGTGYDENMQSKRTYVDIKQRNQPVIDAMLKDAKKFENASAKQIPPGSPEILLTSTS